MEHNYILPAHDVLVKEKQNYRRAIQDTMVSVAFQLGLITHKEDALIRGIKCSDLGLTSWQIPPTKKETLTNWIHITNYHNKILCIYKVIPLSATPTVSRLVIRLDQESISDFGINSLYSLLPIIQHLKTIEEEDIGWTKAYFGDIDRIRMEGYFSEPIIIGGGKCLDIEISTKCDSQGQEELLLDGFVLECRNQYENIPDIHEESKGDEVK